MVDRIQLARQELARRELARRRGIETGLPGRERVEELQSQRTPAIETFKEELRTPTPPGFIKPLVKGLVTAGKALPIPFEAGESAGGRVVQKLQEIPKSFLPSGQELRQFAEGGRTPTEAYKEDERKRKQERFGYVGELGKEAKKGFVGAFTGEEDPVQFGDSIRRLSADQTLTNEAAAKIVGFATAFSMSDPIMFRTMSKSVDALGKLHKSLSVNRILRPSSFERIIPAAQQWVDATDDIVRTIGAKIGNKFKEVGSIKLNADKVNRILQFVPDSVRDFIKTHPDARRVYKIKLDKNGKVLATAKNIWNLRKYLDDLPTQKDFITGTGSTTRQSVINAGNAIRPMLANLSDDMAKLMDDYGNIINRRNFIRSKLIDPSSGLVKEGAKNILKQFQTKAVLREMAKIVPETADLVKAVAGANFAAGVARGAKGIARTAATIGFLRAAFGGRGGETSLGAGGAE